MALENCSSYDIVCEGCLRVYGCQKPLYGIRICVVCDDEPTCIKAGDKIVHLGYCFNCA